MDRSTGSKNKPCTAPSRITRNTILKNVMKMYEGAIMSPITPRMVEIAPCTMGRPRPYRLFLTLSSGGPSLSR